MKVENGERNSQKNGPVVKRTRQRVKRIVKIVQVIVSNQTIVVSCLKLLKR